MGNIILFVLMVVVFGWVAYQIPATAVSDDEEKQIRKSDEWFINDKTKKWKRTI